MPEAIRYRGVHLDLKGAPLPIDALIDEIEQMARWGINLLLVEYEDTFPYAFDMVVRARTAYTPDQIQRLVRTCKDLGVELVPLVQTFGHMEFVLKHPRYADLAQTAGAVSSIDPTLPESRDLVLKMVDELLAAHPEIRWLHLGGDEVWDLGEGERSKARAAEIGKDKLYLEHMMPIIEHVVQKGVRPILWDDMMRPWPAELLAELAPKVDLMPWSYGEDPIGRIGQDVLDRFAGAGLRLWAGAAFKGADGLSIDLPNDRVRMRNLEAWARYAAEHDWQGMVATGWSRYNGMATYCELWQAAPMALYLAAEVMRNGKFEADDWNRACRETIGVENLPIDWATTRTPHKALNQAGGPRDNDRLAQLKTIAAIAQWRRQAHHLLVDRWQGFGYFEDPGRLNKSDVDRIREQARHLETSWPRLGREFEVALGDVLHEQDIRDYLSSRERFGREYLAPLLASR